MNGLDSIVNKILEEAKGEADAILADAQKQADEMLGEADQEAQRQAAQRWESAEKKAESIRAAKVSAAHLSGRERILAAKGQAIDQILNEARHSLMSLPEGQYFAMLKKLILAHVRPGEGEMLLSQEDKDRLPKRFLKEVNAEIEGGNLSLSEETAELGGGVILRYGGVEENCSLDALFRDRHETLQDRVAQVLFHV